MADIEPPSFSLGLDLDLDFELPCQAPDSPIRDTSAPPQDDVSCRLVTDPCPDSPPDPPPLFRRLRRGPPTKTNEPPVLSRESEHPFSDSIDDDIEEFSPEELVARPDEQTAPKVQSVCSGTKFSLHGRGIVTKQPAEELCRKRKQDLDAPSTSSVAERVVGISSQIKRNPVSVALLMQVGKEVIHLYNVCKRLIYGKIFILSKHVEFQLLPWMNFVKNISELQKTQKKPPVQSVNHGRHKVEIIKEQELVGLKNHKLILDMPFLLHTVTFSTMIQGSRDLFKFVCAIFNHCFL